MKTASGHLMPPQHYLYNGLALPADYAIFAREWTRPAVGDSMLVQEWACLYGQRGWPTISTAGRADVGTGQIPGQRDRHGENITPPLYAMLYIAYIYGDIINRISRLLKFVADENF